MGKTQLTFTRDYNSLMKIVRARRDRGDYWGAVSAMQSALKLSSNKSEANNNLAELYYDMEQYNFSLYYRYFSYANSETKREKVRAIEGLIRDYRELNKFFDAAHYFNVLCEMYPKREVELPVDVAEFFEEILSGGNGYKITYPLEEADFRDLLDEARTMNDDGEHCGAIQILQDIPPKNPLYINAQNEIAVALLFLSETDKAEEAAKNVLKIAPNDIEANCIMANICYEKGQKSDEYIEKILSNTTDDYCLLYRITDIMCDADRKTEALDYIHKLLKMTPYNIELLYLQGVVNFKLMKFKESRESFSDARILMKHPVIEYADKIVSDCESGKSDFNENLLGYEFFMPEKIMLNELSSVENKLKAGEATFEEIKKLVRDALCTNLYKIKEKAIELLIKWECEETDDYLQKLLIDPFLINGIKEHILSYYARRNEKRIIKAVIRDRLIEVETSVLYFSGTNAELFTEIFVRMFAKFVIIGEYDYTRIMDAVVKARNIYSINKGDGKLDVKTASAAISYMSKINSCKSKEKASRLFGVSQKKMNEALKLLSKE